MALLAIFYNKNNNDDDDNKLYLYRTFQSSLVSLLLHNKDTKQKMKLKTEQANRMRGNKSKIDGKNLLDTIK